ncbi:DNA helicase [Roseibium sp. SCP14]|uniref:DNA helicase n=1 Tax=Roseibium sp. SCP14 TaxID=3141375 RepID=UPI00333DD3F4
MKLSAPLFRLKRQARQLAREAKLPLHVALDRVAAREGFCSWSHLSSAQSKAKPETHVLGSLANGEMLLLAARPGHGKTIFGLNLLAEAAKAGTPSTFFSVECSEKEIKRRLPHHSVEELFSPDGIQIDLSEDLCADLIVGQLSAARPGTVAVIDYLQALDQRRTAPELEQQIRTLKNFATRRKIRLVFLSQIHRSFDPERKRLPDFSDLRLPNPVDLSLFTKGCFLHDGQMALLAN